MCFRGIPLATQSSAVRWMYTIGVSLAAQVDEVYQGVFRVGVGLEADSYQRRVVRDAPADVVGGRDGRRHNTHVYLGPILVGQQAAGGRVSRSGRTSPHPRLLVLHGAIG